MNPESSRDANRRDLAQIGRMGLFAEFHASNAAAGPCSASARLDGKRYRPGTAPVPPFDDCTHPDQCTCMYQARLRMKGA